VGWGLGGGCWVGWGLVVLLPRPTAVRLALKLKGIRRLQLAGVGGRDGMQPDSPEGGLAIASAGALDQGAPLQAFSKKTRRHSDAGSLAAHTCTSAQGAVSSTNCRSFPSRMLSVCGPRPLRARNWGKGSPRVDSQAFLQYPASRTCRSYAVTLCATAGGCFCGVGGGGWVCGLVGTEVGRGIE